MMHNGSTRPAALARRVTVTVVIVAMVATALTAARLVSTSAPAGATATFTVTSTADDVDANLGDDQCHAASGACTLRAAVQQANATSGADTIVLAANAVYPLTIKNVGGVSEDTAATGDLDITGPTTVVGNGATIDASGLDIDGVAGGWGDRVVQTLGAGPVTIERVVLTGGAPELLGGGGLLAYAPTTLDRSLVRNNRAPGGGGVLIHGSGAGSVITQSILLANDGSLNGGKGGGVRVNSSGSVSILWSTLTANTASASNGDSLWTATTGSASLTGSIFDKQPAGVACALLGTTTSGGNNIATDGGCQLTGSGDLPNTNPQMDPAVFFIAPKNQSPTINSGGSGCPATDFFGTARPLGNACDRGAVEVGFAVQSTTDAVDTNLADNRCISTLPQGECTLRAAVQQANATAGADRVLLAANALYPLTIKNVGGVSEDTAATGDLDITGPTTVVGNGATIDASGLDIDGVAGGWGDRVVQTLGAGPVTIERVVLTGGAPELLGGGGLLAHAPTTLDRSLVRNNRSPGGGGVLIHGTAAGSVITQSILLANDGSLNGGKGGGVRVNSSASVSILWSTLVANTASASNGDSLWTSSTGAVTLSGSILDKQPTGVACALLGSTTSAGNNIATDGTCQLTGSGDLPGTNPMMSPASFFTVPAEGSPAIDSAGTGCPATDYVGVARPIDGVCDRGAVETSYTTAWAADVENRKVEALEWNTTLNSDYSDPDRRELNNNHRLGKAYANYILGDGEAGDAAIDAIEAQWTSLDCSSTPADTEYDVGCFPGLRVVTNATPGTYPFRSDEGPSRFSFPLLFRLEVIEAATTPAYADSPNRPVIQEWIRQYVDRCNYDQEFTWGTWTDKGSENHRMVRLSQCVLGLYMLRTTPGYDATSGPTYDVGLHWTRWLPEITTLLRSMSKSGLLGEQNYDGYMATTLDMLVNLRDFPTVAGNPTLEAQAAELRSAAGDLLDLVWHDLAQSYNAATHTLGTTGNRHYMPSPAAIDGAPEVLRTDHTDPPERLMLDHLRLYAWDTASPRYSAIPASSDYRPQPISRLVARKVGKDYSYQAARLGRSCGDWALEEGPEPGTADDRQVCQETLASDARHGILSKVTVNDNFMMGATTYEPGFTHNLAFAQNLWYSANVNALEAGDISNHLTVSSVPDFGSGNIRTDYAGINGALQGDVIIAGRDRKVQNPWLSASGTSPEDGRFIQSRSRGVRVWLGKGDIRRNLEAPQGGWYFTRVAIGEADVAYAAIRFAEAPTPIYDSEGKIQELRMAGPSCETGPASACCPDPGPSNPGAVDCWAPVVIQMGRPGTGYGRYSNYDAFKNAVLTEAAYSYAPMDDPSTPAVESEMTVTYTSPFDDTVQMARQQQIASKPRIASGAAAPVPVNTEPAKAYSSPYLDMDWQANQAILRGPNGTLTPTVTIDLTD